MITERSRDGVLVTLPQDEIRRLRTENRALKKELQLAVDNTCNCYHWDGHAERVSRLYGIISEPADPPKHPYKQGGSYELQREREEEAA